MRRADTEQRRGRANRLGFTIPEYVITVGIVGIVTAGMLACYLFGGIICTYSSTKLDYNDDIRGFMADFVHYVRTSADFDIGTGSATSFFPVPDDAPRRGNAIQIYPTPDTNIYVRFFLDTNDQCLRVISTEDTNAVVLTDSVTNTAPFTAEDFSGNVATNDQYMAVAGLLLQFNPPLIKGNKSGLKDYYQFSTRATRRTPLGYQQ
jgi:hypothetical protein